jgi:hypothetical protein
MRTPLILPKHLPNMATHCPQGECGFSVYRGVLVQWDEDHDERILDVLDDMPGHVVDAMIAVQEHEGTVCFVWKDAIPNGWEAGCYVAWSRPTKAGTEEAFHCGPIAEDWWIIEESVVLGSEKDSKQ